MSSMTAEQVWALVKDWPREAWPVMSVSFRNENVVCGSSVELVDGLRIPTPIAAHAFVGSGLAWLARNNDRNCKNVAVGSKKEAGRHLIVIGGDVQWFVYSQPYNGSGDYMECAGRECELGPFPHPLAAVSAAVLAAAKGGT